MALAPALRRVAFLFVVLGSFVPSLGRAADPFVTFESGHVRPLALSPDGTRLFSVNTPDNQLEIFQVGVGTLTHEASVTVGLEPVAVAARSNGEVWVVNHLSDSVSVVDVTTPTQPRVVRTLLVGDEPRDLVFAGPGGNRAFITTAHRGQNTPYQAAIETILETPGIGRADVWVFDATSLGAQAGGTALTIVTLFGDTPRALAVAPDGSTVYAAIFHSGNRTTTLSEALVPNGGETSGGLPEPNTNFQGNPQPEVGLIVQYDGTAWRDELGRNWNGSVNFALPDEDVFAIDADANPPVALTGPGDVSTGVGTILFNMIANPVSGKVYVSNLESFNRVRFEGAGTYSAAFKPLGEPASVRGHLAESRITVLDGGTVTPRHLNKHIDYTSCCAALPNAENDTSLAFPLGMAISSDGATLYVAGFGSSKIGIYDTADLEDDSFVPSTANQATVSGGGPTGIVLDETRSQLYVLTRFDDAISIVSTATGMETAHVKLHNPEPAIVTAGRPFLYDASFASSHGDSACASCHIFGDFDSLAWDLGDPDGTSFANPGPFTISLGDTDFQPMKGPMTTQSLRGMDNHGAMHWRGDRRSNFVGAQPNDGAFDELVAFRAFNPAFAGLLGRSAQIPQGDMNKFTAFILEVMYPPNPIRNLDNSLTPAQQAGRNFYFGGVSDTLFDCNGCHVLDPTGNASFTSVKRPGFFGTDGQSSFENETQHFKIPHLRNMYQKVGMFGMPAVALVNPGDNAFKGDQIRGFGFLHDGSFDTLFRFHNAAVFNQSPSNVGGFPAGAAGDPQRRQVEAFMHAFDSNLAPIVGQQMTRTNLANAPVDARIDLLIARAGAGECDLVAKGKSGSEVRGYVYVGGGRFQPDRKSDATLTDAALRAQANTAGQELTYTCVPPGSGERIALDRDGDSFWDGDERDAGTDPGDPDSAPCSGDPTCGKCQRAVAKATARYAQDVTKARLGCDLARLQGKIPFATNCEFGPDSKTTKRLGSAGHKLEKSIESACGGADKVCGGSLVGEPLVGTFGYPAACPNLEHSPSPQCSNPVTDCNGVVVCAACVGYAAAANAAVLTYGAINQTDPSAQAELNQCQQALGKETQAFVAAKSRALAKCWDGRLKGKHAGPCPDGAAAAGTSSRKAADAIAKAEAKRQAKICKACGGGDGSCDGVNDQTPAAIGFAGSCPNVTIPGGGSCAATISTLADVVDCLGCVAEFRADCVDALGVPALATYPAECNP
jgi:YVTN family beta-propeller protein